MSIVLDQIARMLTTEAPKPQSAKPVKHVDRHPPGYMAKFMREYRARQRYAKLRYGRDVTA